MPQAKLLSKDEQSQTETPLVRRARPADEAVMTAFYSIFFAFFLALTAPRGPALYGKYSRADQPVRRFNFASLSAFFFRPPPVLA
jgi:hypothetical protein